jgi:membrane-bound lytic murein transglycosylase B
MLRLTALALALLFAAPARAEKHPGMEALIAELAGSDRARAAELRALLQGAEKRQAILDAISRPAEAKPWHAYRRIFLTEARIQQGAEFYRQHGVLLKRLETRYGVPGEYVVAIVGVETSYGRTMGSWKVIDALTTLGFYYPPRQAYFRGELKQFLDLPRQRRVTLDLASVKGSYAGAMGLPQFMPTSYLKWAIDEDANGRIDLWESPADALASVANYLKEHGWVTGGPVTVPLVPTPGARRLRDTGLDPVFPFSQLVEWGYQPSAGATLPPNQGSNLLALEDAPEHLSYHAIFGNFRVITRYNRSPLYAMAVHELAQAIKARAEGRPTR